MGAHVTLNPEHARTSRPGSASSPDGVGVDVVSRCAGVPTAMHRRSRRAARRAGADARHSRRTTEVDFARDVIFKGLTLYGVVGRRMYDTWHEMTRFLRSGQFDPTPVITHRFPLERRRRDSGHQGRRGRQSHLGDRTHDANTLRRIGSRRELEQFERDRVYKRLNYLDSPQAARVTMEGRGEVLILSSNNYLGLCDEPRSWRRASTALDRFGAGTASVRFICGTFTIHRELEAGAARASSARKRR